MEIPTDHLHKMAVEEFDTSKLLINAARQRDQRKFEDILIIDCDCHHYENESIKDIIEFIEDPVLRRTGQVYTSAGTGANSPFMMGSPGAQDVAGRVTRYPLRKMEKTPRGRYASRHPPVAPLDGRDGRRLRHAVSDADAASRPPSRA